MQQKFGDDAQNVAGEIEKAEFPSHIVLLLLAAHVLAAHGVLLLPVTAHAVLLLGLVPVTGAHDVVLLLLGAGV